MSLSTGTKKREVREGGDNLEAERLEKGAAEGKGFEGIKEGGAPGSR